MMEMLSFRYVLGFEDDQVEEVAIMPDRYS